MYYEYGLIYFYCVLLVCSAPLLLSSLGGARPGKGNAEPLAASLASPHRGDPPTRPTPLPSLDKGKGRLGAGGV